MKLSERLDSIASMVSKGKILADIGTDHAFIPIKLVSKGTVPSAIAMDIGEGPLLRGKEHIAESGLNGKIETRLSDGLDNYNKGEAGTILLAGMGGDLIISILTRGRDKIAKGDEVIVSPHTHPELVRKFLYENGYEIIDEKIVIDDNKYYFIIKTIYDGTSRSGSEAEYRFGPILINRKDPVLKSYLNKEKSKFEEIKQYLSLIDDVEEIIK